MERVRVFLNRCAAIFSRRRLDADLDEELCAHIEIAIEEGVKCGLSREEARTAALREFGGVTQAREATRSQRGLPSIQSLAQDLRFALRQLRKTPAFTATAVAILTLGIGINTAIFSVVDHVLLEALPFPQSGQLQAIWARSDSSGNPRIAASGPDFLDYHDQNKSFAQIAEMIPHFTETLTGEGEPRLLDCAGVSDDFFAMLGIRPYLGRFYTPAEYADLQSPALVISYRFWKTQLNGDPHVIGRVLHIGGSDSIVVGVTQPMPDLFPDIDLFPTLCTRPSWDFMQWRGNKFLTVIGRLKPGVTPSSAEEELTAILRRAPGEPADVQVRLTPLKDDLVGSVRRQLRIIVLAVGVVLFLACINIAALLSVRAARRFGEMAVRLSLGATRARLRQQLLIEGLALNALAIVPGVGMAWLALRLLPHLRWLDMPRIEGARLDGTALLATGAIAAGATLLTGLAPMLELSRLNLAAALRSRRADTGRSGHRAFSALVIAEIACSMVLAVCAGLLLHSYWRLAHVDPGFEPEQMLTTYLRTNYYTPEGRPFWRDVLEGVATLPGVRAAALADCTPGGGAAIATLVFRDRPNDPRNAAPAEGCWASADFFRVTGTPLIRGRFFDSSDGADSAPVAIVNEEAARKYWPSEDPLGRFIGVNYTGPGRKGGVAPRMRQIVGVVRGMKNGSLEKPTEPAVYMPYLQDETFHDMATMSLFVRSAGDPVVLESSIRARVHQVRADQPIDEMRTIDDMISQSMAPRRYSLSLIAAFAALALVLCSVGIYGIVSFTTLQRTREFGIRIALGATRSEVLALVVRHGLLLTLAGTAIGTLASFVCTRALGQLAFETSLIDGPSFLLSALTLALISVGACIAPALRAARTDPAIALRSE